MRHLFFDILWWGLLVISTATTTIFAFFVLPARPNLSHLLLLLMIIVAGIGFVCHIRLEMRRVY